MNRRILSKKARGCTQHHFSAEKSGAGFTLIEILVVIGIIAILAAIVIIAINPARQFAQARNSQRASNVNAILNAVGQFVADNKGVLPPPVPAIGTTKNIADTGADLCLVLVPTYMPALVVDPLLDPDGAGALGQGQAIPAPCTPYDTGYTIMRDTTNRVTVCAPSAVEPAIPGSTAICVTR